MPALRRNTELVPRLTVRNCPGDAVTVLPPATVRFVVPGVTFAASKMKSPVFGLAFSAALTASPPEGTGGPEERPLLQAAKNGGNTASETIRHRRRLSTGTS